MSRLSRERWRPCFVDKDEPIGRRAAFLTSELRSLGMTPYNQSYTFTLPASKRSHSTRNMPRVLTGINTYARWSAARGDGREALVICAPWRSQWDGSDDPDAEREDQTNRKKLAMEGSMGDYERSQIRRPNVRGVSTVLSLARFLIGHSHWSKDLIFVFGDGHLDGMQAWTSTYFANEQSNLHADRIQGAGALVWNAMAFDYPSDSFSSIVVRHEGLDGQLPNLDVINTLTRVAERINGVPIELSESLVPPRSYQRRLGPLGALLEEHLWNDREGEAKYMGGLLNVFGQLRNLVVGHPTGVHGLFHRFHIDAITLFAKPASGPYGFWHMGRMAESMTRSFSNLLERLHHSQFFYLMTSTQLFIEVAKCIAVAALLGAAMTIRGISIWLDEGRRAQQRREALVELAQESAYRAKIDEIKSNGDSLLYDDQADGDEDEDDEEDEDAPLESPTIPQFLNELISSSILRATRKGHVLSASRIKALTKLLDIQGRPVPATIAIVGCCHLAGAACFWLSSTAPVDCASRGLSKCEPLLAITLVTLFAAILIPIAAARRTMAASEGIIKECQVILAQSAPSHITSPASRTASLARLLQAATLLHAGILVIAASIVNFSLAAATAGLLCLPLCLLMTASQRRGESKAGQRLNRTFWFFTLLFVSPAGLVWLLKGLAEVSMRSSMSTQALAGVPLTAVVERIVDGRLWDWQVLGATFLPYLFLAYMPAALQGCVAAGLAAIA